MNFSLVKIVKIKSRDLEDKLERHHLPWVRRMTGKERAGQWWNTAGSESTG
jgi:hypothetical protein